MSTPSPYRIADAQRPSVVVTTGEQIPGYRVVGILDVVHGFGPRTEVSLSRKTQHAIHERRAALAGLVDEAAKLLAGAVIGLRYDSDGSDVVAYGTAVRIEPDT